MCHVDIDSSMAFECDVLVDGTKQASVKPYSTIELSLKKGKHEFRFMRGQEEVDKIEASLVEEKSTVINPRAAGTYNLATVWYTTGGPFSGRDPEWVAVKSQKVVQADFSLLQALPESIVIRTSRTLVPIPYNDASDSKTKLCKLINPDASAAEVMAMLKSKASVYSIYRLSHVDHVFEVAVKKLGDAPKDQVIMDTLMDIVETCRESPKSVRMDTMFEALKKYLQEIPEQRLVGWVSTPCTNNHETAVERVENSAKFLFALRKEAAITNCFPGLPEINRIRILRASAVSASPEVRSQLIVLALGNCSREVENEVRNLISRHDFEPDETILRAVSNYAASLPVVDENDRNRRRQMERTVVSRLKHKKTLDSKWVTEQLVEYASSDDKGIKWDALSGLVDRDKLDELVKLLPFVDQDTKKNMLRTITYNYGQNQQAVTPAAISIFRLGLTDTEPQTRTDMFRSVAGIYYRTKSDEILTMLKETSNNEIDASAKRSMEDYLRSYVPAVARPASSSRRTTSTPRKSTPSVSSVEAATSVSQPSKDSTGWPVIKVSGIVNSAGGKVAALINGQIVSEGEAVSGVKILSITRGQVELSFNGEKRVISVAVGR